MAQAEDGTIPANIAGSESVTVSTMQQDQASAQTITTGSLTGNGGGIPAFTMTTNAEGGEDYSIKPTDFGLDDHAWLLASYGYFDDVVYPYCGGDVDLASGDGSTADAV